MLALQLNINVSTAAIHRGEQERFRRRDLLHALKNRREQIQQSIKRGHQGDRDALLAGSSTAAQQQQAKETEATAELDNQGLVQLQQQVMKQQDQELEQMEKTVISTKVCGCAAEFGWGFALRSVVDASQCFLQLCWIFPLGAGSQCSFVLQWCAVMAH
jgi:SYP5 family syntaxin